MNVLLYLEFDYVVPDEFISDIFKTYHKPFPNGDTKMITQIMKKTLVPNMSFITTYINVK